MKSRVGAVTCLLLAAACGDHDRVPAPPRASSLPAGVLARVGQDSIGAISVARLFASRGLTARAAAELAISDALWAQGARAQLAPGRSRAVERVALARSLLEAIRQSAEAAGPPSEAEINQLLEQRWLELARPPAVRTTHVVVMNDKPERDAAARALAEKLRAALSQAKNSADVLSIGKAMPNEGFEVRPEELSFVTTDGRTFQKQGERYSPMGVSFDPDFARAANALQQVGDLSPVTKSQFGYHVIRLEERDPGHTLPPAELHELIKPEVVARRAAQARGELMQRLRAQSTVQVERAVDDLTALVKASP
ncbi:MAG TPA: peptidylprolyl isomerase [Polyangiaceae bacterium]|nr:peptidylprolyl isomerase [Polyangiaceae bacterium]